MVRQTYFHLKNFYRWKVNGRTNFKQRTGCLRAPPTEVCRLQVIVVKKIRKRIKTDEIPTTRADKKGLNWIFVCFELVTRNFQRWLTLSERRKR